MFDFPLNFFVSAGKIGAGKCRALISFLAKVTGTALLLLMFVVETMKS